MLVGVASTGLGVFSMFFSTEAATRASANVLQIFLGGAFIILALLVRRRSIIALGIATVAFVAATLHWLITAIAAGVGVNPIVAAFRAALAYWMIRGMISLVKANRSQRLENNSDVANTGQPQSPPPADQPGADALAKR